MEAAALRPVEAIMAKAGTRTEQLWAKKHIADIEASEGRNNRARARELYQEILDEACCDPELVQWCLLDLDRLRKKRDDL